MDMLAMRAVAVFAAQVPCMAASCTAPSLTAHGCMCWCGSSSCALHGLRALPAAAAGRAVWSESKSNVLRGGDAACMRFRVRMHGCHQHRFGQCHVLPGKPPVLMHIA